MADNYKRVLFKKEVEEKYNALKPSWKDFDDYVRDAFFEKFNNDTKQGEEGSEQL